MEQKDPSLRQLSTYLESNPSQERLTSTNGVPLDSLSASLTVGPYGTISYEDSTLFDYLMAFDHEKIPQRVVHAKGAGAKGNFEVTTDEMRKVCKAKLFNEIGKKTNVMVRFSNVTGDIGSPDTSRDPRGFAMKFYTEEGNWDLVAINTPIFFIRDPILFPSFVHSQKRNPKTNLKDPNMAWDFLSLRPESIHQTTFLFTDRGIPDGYRFMNGYGSHTFKTVNEDGIPYYVKFHLKSKQGIKNLSLEKAIELAGSDPDYATRDLFNAISKGDFPTWTMFIQVMTFDQAEAVDFNPFDLTKVWPHQLFPLLEVGSLTLNQNPVNYFAEVEQLAFSPAFMVPGIYPSPDKILQGRLFSYIDSQHHRLGSNYLQIPVNCPYSKVASYQRDGLMNISLNGGGGPNYFPNSFSGPTPDPKLTRIPSKLVGDVNRYDTGEEDNFSQVRTFYEKVLTEDHRERLAQNIALHLGHAEYLIQERALSMFYAVNEDYGNKVQQKLYEIFKVEFNRNELPQPRSVHCAHSLEQLKLREI